MILKYIKNTLRSIPLIQRIIDYKDAVKEKRFAKMRAPYIEDLRKIIDKDTTIISSNCFAGRILQDMNAMYNTPTLGLYFWYPDYVEFLQNLKYYLTEATLEFVDHSKYPLGNERRKNWKHWYPIGLLDGKIEIQFLHYHTENEAREKWNRRKNRINWDNLIIIGSEQNLCTPKDIIAFNNLPYKKKIFFSTKAYPDLDCVCCLEEFSGDQEVGNPFSHGDIYYREMINYFKKRRI